MEEAWRNGWKEEKQRVTRVREKCEEVIYTGGACRSLGALRIFKLFYRGPFSERYIGRSGDLRELLLITHTSW